MNPEVTKIESDAASGQGIIGNLPAIVFQMSAVLTFQAFQSGSDVLVKMNNTVHQPNKEQTLTPNQPTASIPYSLYVGNGWMQLNDGVINLELHTENGQPKQVLATAYFTTCNSSTGSCFGTLGGTFILPL